MIHHEKAISTLNFSGQIDDVRIYNYSLTPVQIKQIYNQGGGIRFGPQQDHHKDMFNRHTIRLRGYDYAQSGYYFVTICTQNREFIFGDIVGATRGSPISMTRGSPVHTVRDAPAYMKLNTMGKIVENIWNTLPDHHPVMLDTFQIMPNHIHFIIQIIDAGGSRPIDAGGSRSNDVGASPLNAGGSRPAPTTLGTVVGSFKSACSKQINIVGATRGSCLSVGRPFP